MNLFPEHKGYLKGYAVIFLLFGFVLLVCGTMLDNKNSSLGKHQEIVYRQDKVHYWAALPFMIHGILSILFIVLEINSVLKFCICMDYICLNLALFVIVVEGSDWKKYRAKAFHYNDNGDIDYKMLKPNQDFGSHSPLQKSSYFSAMFYSGTLVFVAICSILLCVETLLMHIKVYCGIKSIYAYLSGYELVSPEISLKTARPIEKFECKGCQTKPPTPTLTPIKETLPTIPEPSPLNLDPMPQCAPDALSIRSVSPAFSDASNVSNAFYVCQDGGDIKLVGYKPHRRDPHVPQLCTHHEDEEASTDHYHFSKKHPSLYESDKPHPSDPQVAPSFPRLPPLSLIIPPKDPNSRGNSPTLTYPSRRRSAAQSPLVSPFIPIAPAPPPLPLLMMPGVDRSPIIDRSPGKYPLMVDIFPPPPSSIPAVPRQGRRVSFDCVDPSSQPSAPTHVPKTAQKLDTLI